MSDFGTRLKQAIKNAGRTQKELAENIGITQQSVQYLCSGKARSSKDINKIARFLNVSAEWLESGTNEVREQNPPYAQFPVPVFTIADLDNSRESTLSLPCPFEHSSQAFALKIEGDPATANPMHPQYGRAYPVGSIVFADPALADQCENNDIVIAELTERPNKVTAFRQLYREAGTEALRPLNPQFPMTTEPFRIVAKVIGAILP